MKEIVDWIRTIAFILFVLSLPYAYYYTVDPLSRFLTEERSFIEIILLPFIIFSSISALVSKSEEGEISKWIVRICGICGTILLVVGIIRYLVWLFVG